MYRITNGLNSSINKESLFELLCKQLNNFFFIDSNELDTLKNLQDSVLERLAICIGGVDNKFFKKDGEAYFSPYHSGQYLTYLYFYSNEIAKRSNSELKDKIYYLNKILHSVDIYCEVAMPDVFFLEHPLGTVLGRAKYGNNFFAMQGCTVGGNKGCYPVIGEHVKMYSNSKILGNSNIGNNVLVSANCYIKDVDIPNNVTVFGQSPNLIIKNNK